MQALMGVENVAAAPIAEGDAGIILKPDGTWKLFNTHKGLDPKNLTPAQLEQGRKLMAFSIALQIPSVMQVLYDIAEDPEISDVIVDTGTKH